jgi:alkanesulfonate monooxygenase SsuD/methylene tetrahydromethanopterin reductase-like flavin-dependent oxidoreductase (luciferase family)
LGIGYSFAAFINPDAAVPALRAYRRTFKQSQHGAQTPQAMLGVNVFAADTDAEAHRMTWPTRGRTRKRSMAFAIVGLSTLVR